MAALCMVGTFFVTTATARRDEIKSVDLLRQAAKQATFNDKWHEVESNLLPLVEKEKASASDKFLLGFSLHKQDRISDARKWFIEAEIGGYSNDMTQYNLACGYARQSQTQLALDHLEAAINNGFTDSKWISKDPDLKSIRENPQFKVLVSKAKTLCDRKSKTTKK